MLAAFLTSSVVVASSHKNQSAVSSSMLQNAAIVLLPPVRAALGAVAMIGTATLVQRAGFPRRAIAASGISALAASQVILYHVQKLLQSRGDEENNKNQAELRLNGTMAWNEAIGAVRNLLETLTDGLVTPCKLKRMLVDLEVLRKHHSTLFEDKKIRHWEESNEDELERGRHFASFAMASYGFLLLKLLGLIEESHDVFADGSRPIDIVMHQLDLRPSDILVVNLDGHELGVPRHYIARDSRTKNIVIVVRGTISVSDVLVDVLCHSAPFASGYAHSGMSDAAHALFAVAKPILENALRHHPTYSIVTAGHSLGAGVAILLTKILLDDGFSRTKCYAISPPPVFGPVDCIDPGWSSALECFVHEDDLVPRLSLRSARALALEIERLDNLPFGNKELKTVSSNELRAALEKSRDLRFDSREESVLPLHIPTSHVHWLLRDDKGQDRRRQSPQYRSVRAETSIFDRIVVTGGCIQSHFPSAYISAFESFQLKEPKISTRRKRAKTRSRWGWLSDNGELGH